MPSLNMGEESYPFTSEDIGNKVTRTSPGNYALGYVENNSFYVKYVGRSDQETLSFQHNIKIHERLHDY